MTWGCVASTSLENTGSGARFSWKTPSEIFATIEPQLKIPVSYIYRKDLLRKWCKQDYEDSVTCLRVRHTLQKGFHITSWRCFHPVMKVRFITHWHGYSINANTGGNKKKQLFRYCVTHSRLFMYSEWVSSYKMCSPRSRGRKLVPIREVT